MACGTCVPYKPDLTCCPDWGDLSDDLLCRATDLAWLTLRTLTAGQVGNCPSLVRPCLTAPCSTCDGLGLRVEQGCFTPAPGCGRASGCSCRPMHEIRLPGPVAEVYQVSIDGALLDTSSYRVDNGNRLLRTDGEPWPSCQDMSLDVTEVGTMGVWYVPGIVPSAAGLWAAGVLVCEFTKACTGGKCRLPSTVTSVARQGVTMELKASLWVDGLTGIREVDAYIVAVNPNALRQPAKVWSPDLAEPRTTTYQFNPPTIAAP